MTAVVIIAALRAMQAAGTLEDANVTVVLTGDGAFLMGPQIVATAVEYSLPVVWVILNNLELGIERKGSSAAASAWFINTSASAS